MKKLPAIIAVLVTMGLILGTMLAVGIDSYIKSVSAESLPALENSNPADTRGLQDLVSQYQSREKEFQALLTQAQERASLAESQVQQYEQLFTQLQEMGVIRVDTSGQISLRESHEEREHYEDD